MHNILSNFLDWWKDREDERLDEIVGLDHHERAGNNATDARVLAYQLVKSARSSRNDS
jgi:hypothetical protein